MKRIVILFLILNSLEFALSVAYCQSTPTDTARAENRKNSIGIAVGFTTGYGLSYRRYFNRAAIQLTSGPTYSDRGDNARISSGLTLFFRLNKEYGNAVNYNLYFSNHYFYKRTSETVHPIYPQNINVTTEEHIFNSGFGINLNFRMRERLDLDMMIGYAQYNSFERLSLTVETGLYFKFN